MKTLKYISKTVGFLKGLNVDTKVNTEGQDDLELTDTRFGINLKPVTSPDKEPNSLLSLMYSEENETLFI